MFLGLLVREREPYRDGHRGNLPSRVFLPISSFCFFPVSFRFASSFSFLSHETLLFFPFDVSPYERFALTAREK